ncbi:uncharacterized protein EV420DRAFT_849037 [Desarmillaria tabescens]|uniref:Uncharacterized protein n=1 Tax=Armillaria tabescens TaxID=1929756 RepID=A0AA39JX68_ARMTA|nr:uncharacterized protein EV420DRAFT_849037 [Desarmillaria tabescens]KAK0448258.1 hypothetical protein EV420DRAFT_849037 [Desarmillaria tabescens]
MSFTALPFRWQYSSCRPCLVSTYVVRVGTAIHTHADCVSMIVNQYPRNAIVPRMSKNYAASLRTVSTTRDLHCRCL